MKKLLILLLCLPLIGSSQEKVVTNNFIEVNSIDLTYSDGKGYYNGNLFTGKLIEKYNNIGKLIKYPNELYYKNGLRNGRSSWYFDNGRKSMESNYNEGKIEGYKIRYNQKNDTIRWEYKIHGSESNESSYLLNTIYRNWHEGNGQLLSEEHIDDGKFVGQQIEWDISGNIHFIEHVYGKYIYKRWDLNDTLEISNSIKKSPEEVNQFRNIHITDINEKKHVTGRSLLDRNCNPHIYLTGLDTISMQITSDELLSSKLQIASHCETGETIVIRHVDVIIFHANTACVETSISNSLFDVSVVKEKIEVLTAGDQVWLSNIIFQNTDSRGLFIYNTDFKIFIK